MSQPGNDVDARIKQPQGCQHEEDGWTCGASRSNPLHAECPDGPGSECDVEYHHAYVEAVPA